jgi:hypothetical protein
MDSTEKKITESDLINLLNEVSFDRIELGLKSANIFDILKISRAEIRHSNFLGWLFDPNEGHGLNELVLKRFLRDLFSEEQAKGLNSLDADKLDYRNAEVRREWQNIDILIIVDSKVICVENKVDTKDHSNQLKKYHEIVNEYFPKEEHIFVYLTPQGDPPTSTHEAYIPYSYIRFAENLEKIIEIHGPSLNDKILNYLNDYMSVLKRTIMKNDNLNELAVELYKTHKATLDFIFENKPDEEIKIRELFEDKVKNMGWVLGSKNKGYVRFLTPILKDIIPTYKYSNGWPNKEAFLFEIDFYWSSNKKTLVFKTCISPGDEDTRVILKEVLSSVEGAAKPWGEKWVCHFIKNQKFSWEKLEQLTENEQRAEIDKIWPEIEEIVLKVEQAFINDGRLNKKNQ